MRAVGGNAEKGLRGEQVGQPQGERRGQVVERFQKGDDHAESQPRQAQRQKNAGQEARPGIAEAHGLVGLLAEGRGIEHQANEYQRKIVDCLDKHDAKQPPARGVKVGKRLQHQAQRTTPAKQGLQRQRQHEGRDEQRQEAKEFQNQRRMQTETPQQHGQRNGR